MGRRRQRRRVEKPRRDDGVRPQPVSAQEAPVGLYVRPAERVERLTYTRRQAAEALGVSVSTIDRRVVPVLRTIRNEWGMRLIPVSELTRYLEERTTEARAQPKRRRRPGRRTGLHESTVARIHAEHTRGRSLAETARGLNADGVKTSHGGRRWWPSTVRSILMRVEPQLGPDS